MAESARERIEALFADRRNRLHWFGVDALAQEFGVSETYVKRIFSELQQAGWNVESRVDGNITMYKASAPDERT